METSRKLFAVMKNNFERLRRLVSNVLNFSRLESGQLGLVKEEVDVAVGALSSIIEPVMILLLGSMVGLIAISVFGPITKAETGVQG